MGSPIRITEGDGGSTRHRHPLAPCARSGDDAARGRTRADRRDLLARVADGDRDAFGDLYQRYARAVLGLALRRLGDRGRAEDAVQEAFASVWRAARTYKRDRGPVAPWLYAVARNAIADRGRARIEPPAELIDSPSDEPGPDAQAEQSWVAWRVHRALETLPDSERTVLELAYWRGLSQSEVAAELGIPLGTVKTRTRFRPRPARKRARRGAGMSTPPDFRDLVGDEGTPEELAKLRRAHDMLVAAGPPPELSPGSPTRRGRPRPESRRQRWIPRAAFGLAAAVAAAAFGVG